MDVCLAVKFYINRMIEECGQGMKVLLMDKETTSIISMVFSQSDMLAKEVYLFERMDRRTSNEPMKYLKCIVFVRPTEENVELLQKELRSPKYGQYYLYFSNVISKTDVKLLAEADEHEVVQEVEECYADYIAVAPHVFSLNVKDGCYQTTANSWNPHSLIRCVQGIASVLLSLKRCPTIRYQASSEMCKRLAEGVRQVLAKEGSLFTFRPPQTTGSAGIEMQQNQPAVLLILDRRSDPVTPLLNQWTYQAMLHELLTINNNRVDLSHVEGVSKELREVVISPEHDDFYKENMYLNYGEIGANIKKLMDEFQSRTKGQQKVETIADMKNFIENYPQFRKMSGTVAKHVTLISELSRLITNHSLFDVSEAEQELACQSDHSESVRKVRRLVASDRTREADILRLVLLYALRYDKHSNNDVRGLLELLRGRNIPDHKLRIVRQVVNFASSNKSQGDGGSGGASDLLLSADNVKSLTKKMIKGLKGVENIYTQHSPLVAEVVQELCRGRLKAAHFPYLGTVQLNERPREVIVFQIGGTTYEESLAIHQLNQSSPGTRVVLGASAVHNSCSFLEQEVSGMQRQVV